MMYQATCKLHGWTGEERSDYGEATADLGAHLESDHWTGVVTIADVEV